MMLPNQVATQTFPHAGKGGYKASDVDAYIQRVSQNYTKLYNENKLLNEKISELYAEIEEYAKSKAVIADALIWAKTTAEKNIEEANSIAERTVTEAKEKADKLLSEKKSEADAYYEDKINAAERNLEKAKRELEDIKKQSEIYSERYIAEINVKTRTIIEDANAKSATIVSEAKAEAVKIRENAQKYIAKANGEISALRAEAAKIKDQMLQLIGYAQSAADKITISDFSDIEYVEIIDDENITAKSIDPEDIEEFSFDGIQDVTLEEPEEEQVKTPEAPATQPDYVRFFGADIPDVNDILSGIFAAVKENAAKNNENGSNEEENSFRFEKVVSDFDRPSERKPFDYLQKDSEDSGEQF